MDEEQVKKPIFEAAEDGSKFTINFDQVLERDKLSVYNQFDMSAKRNFKMILNLIKETYETIFLDENGDLKENLQITFLQLLNAQSKIMQNQTMTTTNFIEYLHKIAEAGNSALLSEIKQYVESGYSLTLDADTKKMKEKNKAAVNDQLIISDEYGKILIQIGCLERIMIPLISQFFIYNKAMFPTRSSVVQDDDESEDLLFGEVNQKIFNDLFILVAGETVANNIQNKLYKLVYSRIMRTSVSSGRFWSVARSVGISKESASLDIYAKLLSNSIPKLLLNKELNLVNFFSTIINNQIVFLFSNKFRCHYQTLNPNMSSGSLFESNDDSLTDLERLEIQLGHKNEGSLVLNEVITDEIIKNIDVNLGVAVTKEEINSALRYIHANPIQERIVSLITFRFFKCTDAIKRITAYDYAKILISCEKYLKQQKFVILPKLLISKCVKQRDRLAITGTRVKTKIEESKRYRELISTKYADFRSDIEKNIQAMISTIYSSSFIDESGNDVIDVSAKIGNVAEEIIDLCFII